MQKLSEQAYRNKINYTIHYDKTMRKGYCLKFNKLYDAEIIHKLDTVGNKQDYIRTLILNDIKAS